MARKAKEAERTLSRTKHDLPVKLDKGELIAAGMRLVVLLADQGQLERESKELKTEIKTREDELQTKVDLAAQVIRSGEEVRPVEVEIRADFKAGKVIVIRLDTMATVTTRELTDAERQKRIVFDGEPEEDAAEIVYPVSLAAAERSPLPDGNP